MTSELPAWLPEGRSVRTFRAGRHWDAVRVPAAVAEQVLDTLGDRTGAVWVDHFADFVWWLVPAGAADSWTAPHSVAYGVACWVTIPGPNADERSSHRWVRTIADHAVLTGPRVLTEALKGCTDPGGNLVNLSTPGADGAVEP